MAKPKKEIPDLSKIDITSKTEKLLDAILDEAPTYDTLEKLQIIELATKFIAVKAKIGNEEEWGTKLQVRLDDE
jgi:hypothetical protein